MEIIKKTKHMVSNSELLKTRGEKIGLVPTMGYLHKGHTSLIKRARAECSKVFVSIFVNPIQFGPKEDLARYPRNFKRDCSFCEKAGADYIFFPSTDEMYEKDLKIPVEIAECPTVREEDGLAISPRNKYLSPDERKNAVVLFQSLKLAEELIMIGQKNLEIDRKAALEKLESNPFVSKIDYFDFRDKDMLYEVERIDQKAARILIASAIWIGETRLIDNILLENNF